MNDNVAAIPLVNLALGFIPVVIVWLIVRSWSLPDRQVILANARMLLQLLLVGYVLNFIFDADRGLIVVAVLAIMLLAASWIALRPLARQDMRIYGFILVSIIAGGVTTLVLVTQGVLSLTHWYEPHYMIPLAGMIFSNCMNAISLGAERFESERRNNVDTDQACRVALNAALIPQINSLLAVGIVALPGMMTGQILSGVSPLIAAQYQIVVMCMIFGSAGISTACYLTLMRRQQSVNAG
ncbi:MAG: ABC transporter permease [Gammaproteobacteria bacterium]|nr:ABC transporter permease [Gammaproteobacteria bacterium]